MNGEMRPLAGMAAVLLGAVAIGFASSFVRLSDLEPTASAFYRCFLAGIVILGAFRVMPALRSRLGIHDGPGASTPLGRIPPGAWWPGIFFAIDLALWHKSILLTGAGIATVLANTQIFFVLGFAAARLRERIGWPHVVLAALAFGGVAMIGSSAWSEGQVDAGFLRGVVLGFGTGVAYAGYLLSFRALRPAGWLEAFYNLGWVSLFCGLALCGFAVFEGSMSLPVGLQDWLLVLGLVFLCQIAGWLLISWGSARLPASQASSLLLMQPVSACVLGVVWLGERWTPLQTWGCLLTLAAVLSAVLLPRTAPVLGSNARA